MESDRYELPVSDETNCCRLSPMHHIERDGFAVVDGVFDSVCDTIAGLVADLPENDRVRKRNGIYGVRDLFSLVPAIAEMVRGPEIARLVAPVLGDRYFAVRSIFFDKPSDANWMVPWHQDLTIAVRHRVDVADYGPWSTKAGIQHVQPPVEVLARMLTVRIHLDDCMADNGALEVIPGSHGHGRLTPEQTRAFRQSCKPKLCEVPRGGCVIMRPLLLHASKPSVCPGHRRVVHIEFAAETLPGGLEWYECIEPA